MASFFTELEPFEDMLDGTYVYITVGKYRGLRGHPLICRYSTSFKHIQQATFVYVNFTDEDFIGLDMSYDGTFRYVRTVSEKELLEYVESHPSWFI